MLPTWRRRAHGTVDRSAGPGSPDAGSGHARADRSLVRRRDVAYGGRDVRAQHDRADRAPGHVEAFRRAESLVAQRRPLDALEALAPLLEAEPDARRCTCSPAARTSPPPSSGGPRTAFLRVLELDPTDHYARFALGQALQRQSRLTEAQTQLRMAVAMDPGPEYQEALGEVSARIAVRSRPAVHQQPRRAGAPSRRRPRR